MATKNLGPVTAYAYAKEHGYTGTETEFAVLMADLPVQIGNIENLQVTATTLSEGSQATASYSNGTLTLGIPKGDKGDTGELGKVFGAKWDRTTNKLTRTRDASSITTDITNFCHKGSINSNFNNPFNNLYPWSDMFVCNVDLTKYKDDHTTLEDCIVATWGDPDFTYKGTQNLFVGRYRPEFWYKSIEDSTGVEFLVSQTERAGYIHSPEAIDGVSYCIDVGDSKVTAGSDIPLTNIAVSTIHARAKSSGFTLQDIFSIDAQIVLYLVEYADMNIQSAIGNGCDSYYGQGSYAISAVSTDSAGNTVITLGSSVSSYMKVGGNIDIGITDGATTYKALIKSYEQDGSNYIVTLDRALANVTVGMYASFHGFSACEFDLLGQSVGNASGYIGTNGKANAFYRGALLYANRYSYILGIYRQGNTNHIWLCKEPENPDNYDALNTSKHTDTGIALPDLVSAGWQTVGGNTQRIPGLAGFMATGESSGSSSSPVGDQQYVPLKTTGNTILFFGGRANNGWHAGVFCGDWAGDAGASNWLYAGLPILKKKSV